MFSKKTKVLNAKETLVYLDNHPSEALTTRQDSNESSDLSDAIIAGATKKLS